jgi:hypothetical protein
MKFKLLGLTWDLKPILFFLWAAVVIVLMCGFLIFAMEDKIIPAMLCALGCFIWSYINHTLANNGII